MIIIIIMIINYRCILVHDNYDNYKVIIIMIINYRCILVGDHHQLPPLVQSKSALQNGLGVRYS